MWVLWNSARPGFRNSRDMSIFSAALRAAHTRFQRLKSYIPSESARQIFGFEPARVAALTPNVDEEGTSLVAQLLNVSKRAHRAQGIETAAVLSKRYPAALDTICTVCACAKIHVARSRQPVVAKTDEAAAMNGADSEISSPSNASRRTGSMQSENREFAR